MSIAQGLAEDTEDFFGQYLRMRDLSRVLNNKIVETLNRRDMMAGAKKLGMLGKGVLIAERQEDFDVMMDYCLYSVFHGGMNTVQRYLRKASMTGDELRLLQAMSVAWYSVFQLIGAGHGYITLREIFTLRECRVMDKNLSECADIGLMLAVRLIPFGSWYMTSGTGIPIFRETFGLIEPVLVRFEQSGNFEGEKPFSPNREASFSAQVIRALLRGGALNSMSYEE